MKSTKRNKKNKLEEIQKPRGYDRKLPINKIVGCTDCTGELMFLVKWAECDELDLLPAAEVNENDPAFVINFYEKRCPLNEAARERVLLSDPTIRNNSVNKKRKYNFSKKTE